MKQDGYLLIDALIAAAIVSVGFLAVADSLWVAKEISKRSVDKDCAEPMILSAILERPLAESHCETETLWIKELIDDVKGPDPR